MKLQLLHVFTRLFIGIQLCGLLVMAYAGLA
jgi:hypothetical protein